MFAVPTILEIPTVRAFGNSGAQDWMWAPIWVAQTLTGVGLVLLAALIVRLPDGQFRYERERRFIRWSWVVVAFPALALISNETVVKHDVSFPRVSDIPSPLAVDSLLPSGSALVGLANAGYLVFAVAVALQFMRYRRAAERERKQLRWVLYAGTVGVALGIIPFLLGEVGVIPQMQHNVTELFSTIPMILFPASVVVAVMEPSWIDVDIVIRKSFVYGALSFVILVLYIGVSGALGLGLAAGSRVQIEVAIFLTVIVAIAFQPARRWLQGLADRWVFGERPTKYAAVAALEATIEEAPDPTQLLPQLVDTIQRALRLKWARARLDDGTAAKVGEAVGDPILTMPIGARAEHLGIVECGPRDEGSLDSEEMQLVHTLARQVGMAVANAHLAGRIVNAAEAERRRIERNIHDGAQQELVALVARLGMARARAEDGGVSAGELAQLQEEARGILSDLRDLAQGIHPSVLSDGGILEAVEERCSHLPIKVSLRASSALRRLRFPDDVEGAAYFFVTESLTNVLKHARATRVEVSLQSGEAHLSLAVTDNGRGFDVINTDETGLAGLRDRISALGGTLQVSSRPGGGTRVAATLPAS
jgi:signal transduction histidine kinase